MADQSGSLTLKKGAPGQELREALKAILPAVDAYLMAGDARAQGIKRRVWAPVVARARAALAKSEAA